MKILRLSAFLLGFVLSMGQAAAQPDETDAPATPNAVAPATPAPEPTAARNPAPSDAPEADAPTRAARLSFLEGRIAFRAAGTDTWGEGTLNRPITTHDEIWADADSRAEIHLGSSALRLASHTSVVVTNLDERTFQVALGQGTVEMHVRALDDKAVIEVDTPNAAVTLHRPGAYRISVDPNSHVVEVVVRRGLADVLTAHDAFELSAHSLATLSGMGGETTHTYAPEPADDGFDKWCDARAQREDNPPALKYVSREMVGYEDLDAYGHWQQTDAYGPVWAPQDVGSDWAPYQDGRWSWMDPWGWTWIDDAAWGYAPSHYGRWVQWGSGWAWAPGPMEAYPVYSPALVGFVDGVVWNAQANIVAWFALGWSEAYIPNYYASYAYLRRLNQNVVDIRHIDVNHIHNTQIYTNRGIPGAITSVSHQTMQEALRTRGTRLAVPNSAFAQATTTGFAARVVPKQTSVTAAQAARVQPPKTTLSTGLATVITHHAPAPAAVPFAQREPALRHSIEHPLVRPTGITMPSGASPRRGMPLRPTAPSWRMHPNAPSPHISAPPVIGPHPAPPRFSPPARTTFRPQPQEQPGRNTAPAPAPRFMPAPRIAPVPHPAPAPVPHPNPAPRFMPMPRFGVHR